MNVSFDNLDAIPAIPSRGVAWKKVWALIALVIAGTGTTIGTGAWAGIESNNKNDVLVKLSEKERKEKELTKELEKERKEKYERSQKIYKGSKGKLRRLEDVMEELKNWRERRKILK